jgi:hypothetical protein
VLNKKTGSFTPHAQGGQYGGVKTADFNAIKGHIAHAFGGELDPYGNVQMSNENKAPYQEAVRMAEILYSTGKLRRGEAASIAIAASRGDEEAISQFYAISGREPPPAPPAPLATFDEATNAAKQIADSMGSWASRFGRRFGITGDEGYTRAVNVMRDAIMKGEDPYAALDALSGNRGPSAEAPQTVAARTTPDGTDAGGYSQMPTWRGDSGRTYSNADIMAMAGRLAGQNATADDIDEAFNAIVEELNLQQF